jgi:hypothetical protein
VEDTIRVMGDSAMTATDAAGRSVGSANSPTQAWTTHYWPYGSSEAIDHCCWRVSANSHSAELAAPEGSFNLITSPAR